MQARRFTTRLIALGTGFAMLVGCANGGSIPAGGDGAATDLRGGDLARACIAQIAPDGSYDIPTGEAVPAVIPGPEGTAEGAAAINACIQASVSGMTNFADVPLTPVTERSGGLGPLPGSSVAIAPATPQQAPQAPRQTATPRPSGCPANAGVLYGGTQYCRGGS